MKRSIVVVVACLGVLIGASSAHAAVKVEQWNTPGGQFVNRKDEFPRDLVNGHLVTNVVLPSGYSSRKCWPVMYLLHGTEVPDSTYPVSLQWLEINDGELLKMHIPAILVIPGSGDTWWVNNWWNGLRHPAYESWLLQDIVPMVANRLHVCPERRDHTIAGLSMGGYGAMLLASQLPGYFGTVGSFSGVLSPDSANFRTIYPSSTTVWGPAGGFYATGKDPVALVDNLRHTRVFVGVGNGVATAGEPTDLTSAFEEEEFDQEDLAFAAKARAAGVPVEFDQHAGTHTAIDWFQSLSDMLKWGAFKPVVSSPPSWTFSTVETTGTAWNYKFAFKAPPTGIVQFSYSRGIFQARGKGTVSITPPTGPTVTAKLPFDLKAGKVIKVHHAALPKLTGGYQKIIPVTVHATPGATATAPVTVSFTTAQTLQPGQEYEVAVDSLGASGCTDLATQRFAAPPGVGTAISVPVAPPATATTPGQWCAGSAYAAATIVQKNQPADLIGTILGYGALTLP
jgi:S-formylglutathione hydrolase FrmB